MKFWKLQGIGNDFIAIDGRNDYIDNNTLTVYIRRLRTKIEDDPGNPRRIVTIRRMGYKWNTAD